MALTGRIFGKAKRRGHTAMPVRDSGGGALPEPEFEIGDAAAFWRWFAANADIAGALNRQLQDGGDPERLVRPLFNALQRYDGGLSVLVGMTDAGENELVLSADGVVASFPAVTRLAAAAPDIPGWRVTAFKPRIGGATQLSINGQTIGPDSVTYASENDALRGKINVEIVLPWLDDLNEDARMQIVFLLLDNLLGEYDVATAIGHIEVRMRGKDDKPAGKPLSQLPDEVDGLSARRPRH